MTSELKTSIKSLVKQFGIFPFSIYYIKKKSCKTIEKEGVTKIRLEKKKKNK